MTDEMMKAILTTIVEGYCELKAAEHDYVAQQLRGASPSMNPLDVAINVERHRAAWWRRTSLNVGAVIDAIGDIATGTDLDVAATRVPPEVGWRLKALKVTLDGITPPPPATSGARPIRLEVARTAADAGAVHTHTIAATMVTIGAHKGCHIVIPGADTVAATLSRQRDGTVWIMNLNADGPVRLNGDPIDDTAPVPPGAVIIVASHLEAVTITVLD